MDRENAEVGLPDFSELTPDRVLNLVEESLGKRCTNMCRPLTSYINRVYEVQLEDGNWVIAKFYRPGRWSPEALQDEQEFVAELYDAEVPVVPPVRNVNGELLNERHGMYFALFPKKGGRPCDEPSMRDFLSLGRLLARVHTVGEVHEPRDRMEIHPMKSTAMHLDYILSSNFVPDSVRHSYEQIVEQIVTMITPLFEGIETTRLHGDCHAANILHRPGEGFFLIDFDDMAVGPAVQDLWMLLPAHSRSSVEEIEQMIGGYETFHTFDRHTLRLIEPLRAMRYLHFTAWCARQKADGGFARLAPDWGTEKYWRQEIDDLRKQHAEISDTLENQPPYIY